MLALGVSLYSGLRFILIIEPEKLRVKQAPCFDLLRPGDNGGYLTIAIYAKVVK